MKKVAISILLIVGLALIGIIWVNGNLFAQEEEQVQDLEIDIPFVDRDGDGINDLLQSAWGLRFVERYKNRRAIWNQIMAEGRGEGGGRLIDTDNDGTPDTPIREVMREKMNQLVDTDGDGIPDTPLQQHLGRCFQSFDQDEDGIPDDITPEQIRQYMQEMRQWRKQIRQKIFTSGLFSEISAGDVSVFQDEDNDGIPDDIPFGLRWMRRNKGKNH